MRLFGHAQFKFIESRKKAYIGSAIVLSLGIIMAIFWQVKKGSWLDYGVDFTGGTLIQVHFNAPVSASRLRDVVTPILPGTEITKFGAGNDFLIRAQQFTTSGGVGGGVGERVKEALAQSFGANSFTVGDVTAVGPKVSGELQGKALLAVLISFLATLIYLAFRFEWRFGLAATLATFHDIIFTMGFISAFRVDVSLPTVAAVLTIVGYSLNDTVIIFDRIRENLKKYGRKKPYIDILDESINETLPRTVLTAGTTLATLYALFFLGGETLRAFAEILIVGIMTGTYSSIFVASPILLEIEKRWGESSKRQRAQPSRAATARV